MNTLSRRRFMQSAAALAMAGPALWSSKRANAEASGGPIRPWRENPRYWEHGGEPVLLLGGTVQDNLFQIPDLEEHLDLLVSVGGNYIRNTMSTRDEGNVWAFERNGDGEYDLEVWNEDYWTRFENMLRLTHERGVFVQVEVWAFWDFFGRFGGWADNPWNPANNVTYTTEETTLDTEYASPGYSSTDGRVETHGDPHDFFMTVPGLNGDEVVLRHQQRFVDRILEHTLPYGHVLYCMTNEIHPQQPPEWGWYWAEYIRERAEEAGKEAQVTEMYWEFHFSNPQHEASLDRPDVYTFFEASQNSAINEGEPNWKNLQHAYRRLEDAPRPINHVKIYGADGGEHWTGTSRQAAEAFWRNIIGGSASSRFHRPPAGLGLSEMAQTHIRSTRLFAERLNIFRCQPDSEHGLLRDRNENGAYLTYEPGQRYGVYFPDGGSVELDLGNAPGEFSLRWLNVAQNEWVDGGGIEGGETVRLEPPGDGHWAAVLLHAEARG